MNTYGSVFFIALRGDLFLYFFIKHNIKILEGSEIFLTVFRKGKQLFSLTNYLEFTDINTSKCIIGKNPFSLLEQFQAFLSC